MRGPDVDPPPYTSLITIWTSHSYDSLLAQRTAARQAAMPTAHAQLHQSGCDATRYHCLMIESFECHRICVSLQERLEALKREQEVEAERECTFQPAINGRSARLMAERSEVLKVQEHPCHILDEHWLCNTAGLPTPIWWLSTSGIP